ncbi:MAG: hypothetical protein ACTSPX_06665, partial [Candidatus Thorarchaeota archaeon]
MTLGSRWRQLTLTLQDHTERGRKRGFYRRKSPKPGNHANHVDWWAYDQAQMNETCDVLDSIRIGVDQVCQDLGAYFSRP